MSRRNDKRIRLVEAADRLFHQQGVNTTTLANIASLADVPLGNVYYYFKSKESIVMAVIEYRRKIIERQFEELNAIESNRSRLQSFIKTIVSDMELLISYGDVLGSLCQELGKQGGSISEASSDLMNQIVDWCAKQFVNAEEAQAKEYALTLLANVQGISLLTLTFKNPAMTENQINYLMRWVDSVIVQ